METCPRGCDAFLEYVGIDDGFGVHGSTLCDLWECPACGEQVIGECLDEPDRQQIDDTSEPEYSMECSMCGKETPHRECGMCTHCEQVWNS